MATSVNGPRISELVSALRRGGAYEGLIPNPGPTTGPPPGALTRPMPLSQPLPYLNQQTPLTRPMPLTRTIPRTVPSFPARSPMGGAIGSNVRMTSPDLGQVRNLRLPSPPGAPAPPTAPGSLFRGGMIRKGLLPLGYAALGSAAGQISDPRIRNPLQTAAGGGAVAGMTGNIPLSLAAALTAGNAELGFQGTRDGNSPTPDITDITGGPDWLQRMMGAGTGLATTAATGNAAGVGQALANILPDDVGSLGEVASNIPVIGGLFGGGGGDAEAEAPPPPAPVRDETSLVNVMSQVGLGPQYQAQVLDNYTTSLALMQAQLEGVTEIEDPETGEKLAITPEYMQEAAWQEALSLIPSLKQQEQGDAEYARRTAMIQSEIAQYLPELQGGYNALADLQSSIPTTGMNPQMAAAAQHLGQVRAAGYRTQGDALATALASIPSRLAMESAYGAQQSRDNQIAQATLQKQLAAQYPELFGGGGGSQSDPLADALLQQGG